MKNPSSFQILDPQPPFLKKEQDSIKTAIEGSRFCIDLKQCGGSLKRVKGPMDAFTVVLEKWMPKLAL